MITPLQHFRPDPGGYRIVSTSDPDFARVGCGGGAAIRLLAESVNFVEKQYLSSAVASPSVQVDS